MPPLVAAILKLAKIKLRWDSQQVQILPIPVMMKSPGRVGLADESIGFRTFSAEALERWDQAQLLTLDELRFVRLPW